MKTKELIEELLKLDPSGELDIMVNAGCYDYPVIMGHPNISYIDKESDEWADDPEDDNAEKVISVTADN